MKMIITYCLEQAIFIRKDGKNRGEMNMSRKWKALLCILIVIILALAGSMVYVLMESGNRRVQTSYLQNLNEIYNMEAGIIYNNLELKDGKDYVITYDFNQEEYVELIEKYDIAQIAGSGSEYEKAVALMNNYSGRLQHLSDYDNHVAMNALDLLEYSLDNKAQGINCRAKAQILNEMCLALGIYSRKVWIMPNSIYDVDCHVVNEVWDTALNKWVMLDITNNFYWVDQYGTPLSILEIREHIAKQEFCTPVSPDDKLEKLEKSLQDNFDNFIYIAKDMVYMEYCTEYTLGETKEFYVLLPEAYSLDETEKVLLISQGAIEANPCK